SNSKASNYLETIKKAKWPIVILLIIMASEDSENPERSEKIEEKLLQEITSFVEMFDERDEENSAKAQEWLYKLERLGGIKLGINPHKKPAVAAKGFILFLQIKNNSLKTSALHGLQLLLGKKELSLPQLLSLEKSLRKHLTDSEDEIAIPIYTQLIENIY